MAARPHQRSIHPKISSIPRKRSEATTHLELYKMSVEKNRLQQELQNLKNREKQIEKRLEEIEQHSEKLLSEVDTSKTASESDTSNNASEPSQPNHPQSGFDFQEVYVEY